MKSILVRLGLTALIIGGLAGCGGASIGVNGVTGSNSSSSGTIVAGAVNVAQLSADAFKALQPTATIQSVTIAPTNGVAGTGTPVVKFKVVDQNGNPIVGLGGQSNNPAQTNVNHVPSNYDIAFTLAKLVPAANGEPSRWISFIVTKPAATSTAASGVVVNGGISWTATYPSADNSGTMVDNGDGTYTYTFLRDVTQTQAIINALPSTYVSGGTTYNTADLSPADLTYDPTATFRLGMYISGSQPGTGAAVASGVAPTGAIAVPLVYTFNLGYDFVPAGGTPVNTRNVVSAGSCDGCHDNVSVKRGLGHISTASASNGIPPGAYVGRNDPALCVTCHNDQTKFGFANVTYQANADGSPAYSGAYYRTNTTTTGLDQAAFTYPRMIHQTHMGNQLVYTGYDLNGHVSPSTNCATAALAGANAAQCFNLVGMPQDQRNCTKCHDGSVNKSDGTVNTNWTKDGDNWKNVPSQVACGSCHDGINFVAGTGITLTDRDTDLAASVAVGTHKSGHQGGAQANNANCASCHTPSGIALVHNTTSPSLNSVGLQSGVDTIAYSIKSVTVNSSRQPVITFNMSVNGKAVTAFNPTTTYTNASTGAVVLDPNPKTISGFSELVGSGPSFYVAYAVPQDGVATPADFNVSSNTSLAALLVASGSPKTGSITGPDANGYFTATLTGDTIGQPVTGTTAGTCKLNTTVPSTGLCINKSPIIIPTNAVMVTGAIIGGFTQTNVSGYTYTPGTVTPAVTSSSGGLHVTTTLQKLVATGYTARRVITSAALCNTCHDQLGSNPNFHGGDRNDPTACNICHTANRADNGFAVDSSTWIHGIHSASKRTVPFSNGDGDFSTVLYPGQLKNCANCHMPNTVNFGAGSSGQGGGFTGGTLTGNLLWSTVASGKIATPAAASWAVSNPQLAKVTNTTTNTSPYVTTGTNYGNVFTFANASAVLGSVTPSGSTAVATSAVVVTSALGQSIPADGATLVNSPVSSACSACHTDSTAWAHIRSNGGVLYGARSTSLTPYINAAGTLVSPEGCLACHGQGTIMDAAVVHQQQ